MSVKFSDSLVLRYQTHMKRRYGVVISYETAQLNLDSLATLYLAFTPEVSGTPTNLPCQGGRVGGG
jgi:hypothetical protein